MDEKKTKTISVITIVVILVIIFLITPGLNDNDSQDYDGMTTFAAKSKADEIAKNWSSNPILINAHGRDIEDNGSFHHWNFIYVKWSQGSGLDVFIVNIHSNGEVDFHTDDGNYYYNPIINVTIDSDEAFNIALTNSTLLNFINEHETNFRYVTLSKKSHNITWRLEWYYTIRGDPNQDILAIIEINAITGEIQSVFIVDPFGS